MTATHERAATQGLRLARPVEVAADAAAARPEGAEGAEGAGEGGKVGLRLTPGEQRYLCEFLKPLTDREREVVLTVCDSGTNEQAASRLNVTLATLRTHLMKVNRKLGTNSKTDVVRFAAERVIQGYRAGQIAGADR